MALGKRLIGTGAGVVCNTDSVQAFGADSAFSSNVALYQLDGNANDTTGDYNGTATNVTYATGQFGNAGVFNGSSSYIQASNAISNLESNFSISIWVNSDVNHFGGIINLGGKIILRTSNADLTVWQWNANKLIYDSTAPSANSAYYNYSNINPANTWTHITYVKTGTGNSDHKIYKNGVFQSQPSATNIASAGWTNLGTTIGLFGQSGSTKYNYFDGKIDQVRIFNREITAEEVSTLYNETTSTASNTNPLSDGSGVALYSLDYDASDAGGLYEGTPTDVDFGVGGQINYGARFNGSSSYINLGNNASNNDSTFSVSLWFKTSGHSTTATLINNGGANSGERGYFLGLLSSGYLRFSTSELATAFTYNGNVNYADSAWHHIVLSYDSGTYSIYVDGNTTPITSGTNGTFISTATRPTWIGRFSYDPSAIEFFNGDIDQVRLFTKALNSTEVSTLYAETACVYTSTTDIVNYPTGTTPIAYYKLDNSSEDYSTGGNDGTDTNIEYRFGRFGQAAVFNGTTSSYIDYAPLEPFFQQKQTFTLSLWFYTSLDSSTTGTLFTDYAIQSFNASCYIQNGNVLVNTRYSSSNTDYTSTEKYLNSWNHLVVTLDQTTGERKVYINGTLKDTQTVSSNSWSSNYSDNRVQLGALRNDANNTQNNPYNGKIDQVRIYDAALTSDQITELYNEKQDYITKDASNPFGDSSEVAFYEMENNANDSTGSNDGTATNVTFTSTDPIRGTYEASFNGSSSNIQIDTFSGFTNYNFTLSVWIKTTDSVGYAIAFRDPIYMTFGPGLFSGGTDGMGIYDGTNQYFINNTAMQSINDGSWKHIVMTHDGTNLKGYIDGSLIGTVSTGTTTQFSGGTNYNRIGVRADGNTAAAYDGDIDQVRIFNKALDGTEVYQLYAEGARGTGL